MFIYEKLRIKLCMVDHVMWHYGIGMIVSCRQYRGQNIVYWHFSCILICDFINFFKTLVGRTHAEWYIFLRYKGDFRLQFYCGMNKMPSCCLETEVLKSTCLYHSIFFTFSHINLSHTWKWQLYILTHSIPNFDWCEATNQIAC